MYIFLMNKHFNQFKFIYLTHKNTSEGMEYKVNNI